MGKSTISMVIFHSYFKLPEGTLIFRQAYIPKQKSSPQNVCVFLCHEVTEQIGRFMRLKKKRWIRFKVATWPKKNRTTPSQPTPFIIDHPLSVDHPLTTISFIMLNSHDLWSTIVYYIRQTCGYDIDHGWIKTMCIKIMDDYPLWSFIYDVSYPIHSPYMYIYIYIHHHISIDLSVDLSIDLSIDGHLAQKPLWAPGCSKLNASQTDVNSRGNAGQPKWQPAWFGKSLFRWIFPWWLFLWFIGDISVVHGRKNPLVMSK